MKKNLLKKIIFITFSFIIISSMLCNVNASFNPQTYDPGNLTKNEAGPVLEIGAKVYGTLKNIATIVAILTIAIIGLKYIFGSVEQRAEYKATLVPWFVGAILVVMVTSLLGIIEKFANVI